MTFNDPCDPSQVIDLRPAPTLICGTYATTQADPADQTIPDYVFYPAISLLPITICLYAWWVRWTI